MQQNKFAIDFLTNPNNLYLSNYKQITVNSIDKILPKELSLYHIEEISFEDRAPRKEALENVISSMRIEGITFVYLILGDDKGVHFYYGVAKDFSEDISPDLSIQDIGEYILEPSIKGNFRGSKVNSVKPESKCEIFEKISRMKYSSILEGVPGIIEDNEKFQGVDRLVDVMLGDKFGFMILSKPLNYEDIKQIEDNLYELYSRIAPFSKKNHQDSNSTNISETKSKATGVSKTEGENYSKSAQYSNTITTGENESETSGTSSGTTKNESKGSTKSSGSTSTSENGSEGSSEGKNKSTTRGENRSTGETNGNSESKGTNISETKSTTVTDGSSKGETISNSITLEFVDKKAQEWLKYLDETIIPRLDYGVGKGIFITTSFMFSNNLASLKKLENTTISLYSGEKGNKVPLRATKLEEDKYRLLGMLENFQIPFGSISNNMSSDEIIARAALSQYISFNKNFFIGNWLTTNELGMIAGLPQKEVVGLSLKEEVEFGLNINQSIEKSSEINLGKLVQSGNIIEKIDISLDRESLDKHIFVTGVTGSGKTTTCQKILIDSNLPFLIIEPAKTEYRILKNNYENLIVFTLGKDFITPFRLNPFEFFAHESITSRVDMIKASIEAAFDMEAAIPQIIETAMYECYEDYGWSIPKNKNEKYENPFADGVYAFPTLQDLIDKIETVVLRQGFDQKLRDDYIGSIKARLQGLLVGSKGMMLNTKRSIDFEDLLEKRVVLELEEIRSGTEKALIMGFIMTNLIEAIKSRFSKKGCHSHITLIEEAHRLLSKYVPGENPTKKQGVETFTDMLAEIRKYGESLVIVDQIPNKLTPEVLKNTNTKIVHKLFAQDDKDAIGNTIILDKEQKEFLSSLETGRAIVFSQGFNKAIQVKIKSVTDTMSRDLISEDILQKNVYDYYRENYKRGIISGSDLFKTTPSVEEIQLLIELSRDDTALVMFDNFLKNKEYNDSKQKSIIANYCNVLSYEFFSKYLCRNYYSKRPSNVGRFRIDDENTIKLISEFLQKYISDTINTDDIFRFRDNLI